MKSCCWRADTGLWDLDQPISPVQAPMGCLQSLAEMFWTDRDVGPCQRPLNACSVALYVCRTKRKRVRQLHTGDGDVDDRSGPGPTRGRQRSWRGCYRGICIRYGAEIGQDPKYEAPSTTDQTHPPIHPSMLLVLPRHGMGGREAKRNGWLPSRALAPSPPSVHGPASVSRNPGWPAIGR